MPKKKTSFFIYRILLIVLFLAFSTLLTIYIVTSLSSSDKFDIAISEADRAIYSEYYVNAKDDIEVAGRHAESRMEWLMVLKRAYIVSDNIDDWSFLEKISAKSVRSIKGAEDLWAIYVSSLIWNGKYDKAGKEALRLNSDEYATIRGEAILSLKSLEINPDQEPIGGLIDRLKSAPDPVYYEEIAKIAANDKLLLDAALLYLLEGNYKKAYELSLQIVDTDISPEVLGAIAYDAGEWERALFQYKKQLELDIKFENERWTTYHMIADLLVLTDSLSDADYYYEKSMSINPNGAWQSYLNLSIYYDLKDINKQSYSIMEEAVNRFPDRGEVISCFVQNFNDEYDVFTRNTIDRYLVNNPDDSELMLMRLNYFPQELSPDRYNALLWSFFNKNSSSKDIARFLIWYLIGIDDLEGADLVMQRYIKVNPETSWIPLYESIIVALGGGDLAYSEERYSQAIEILKPLITENNVDWFIPYNLAILYLQLHQFNLSIEMLDKALMIVESKSIIDKDLILSKIYSSYALVYYNMEQYSFAAQYAESALDIDETNSDAKKIINLIK